MNRVAFAIIFPIAVLSGWVLSLNHTAITGIQVRLRVAGYDPRDLLAGHYIRFTLTLPNPCSNRSSKQGCVCLNPEGNGSYHNGGWAGECNARPADCHTFISGSCTSGYFDTKIDRYFISERYSSVLGVAPPNSSVVVALTPSGEAQLLKFLVQDESLEDYAERRLAETSK